MDNKIHRHPSTMTGFAPASPVIDDDDAMQLGSVGGVKRLRPEDAAFLQTARERPFVLSDEMRLAILDYKRQISE